MRRGHPSERLLNPTAYPVAPAKSRCAPAKSRCAPAMAHPACPASHRLRATHLAALSVRHRWGAWCRTAVTMALRKGSTFRLCPAKTLGSATMRHCRVFLLYRGGTWRHRRDTVARIPGTSYLAAPPASRRSPVMIHRCRATILRRTA